VENGRKPWWADDPELKEILRRSNEEFERKLEEREPIVADVPNAVVADVFSGAGMRELAAARDDLARSRERYEQAILAAHAAGLSWGAIGRVLGVSRQLLQRRFRLQ
jgi:hypothetical protein